MPPNGPDVARSTSTWIHWWSPVASAKPFDTVLVDLQPVTATELLAGEAGRARRGCRGCASTGSCRRVAVCEDRGHGRTQPTPGLRVWPPEPGPDPWSRRCCCTTTSTVACAPRRSSSSPPRSATTLPAGDADSARPLVRGVRRLRLAGALPRDLRPHGRGDADGGRHRAGSPASASRTWPPTASSTPRCATPPSSTSTTGLTLDAGGGRGAGRLRGGHDRRPGGRRSSYGSCSPRCGTRRGRARSPSSPCVARRGVVGFDIAGAEAGFPPTRHLDAFEYLQRRELPLHDPRRRGVRAAVDLGGDPVVRRRPARPRRPDRRRHHRRRRRRPRPRPARGVRARQADPARDVPVVQRADRRRRVDRRAPDRAADAARGSGSRSTPTTG